MGSASNEGKQITAEKAANAPKRRFGAVGRVFRWFALAVGGVFAAVVIAAVVYVGFGIPIDLSWLRNRIEVAASAALDRSFAIEGLIKLVPTVWPTVEIRDARIGNPEGWPEADLVRLNLARAQLGILPLLRGEVRIEEITVKGLQVSLETNSAGAANWLLPPSPEEDEPKNEREVAERALRFIELREVSLTDIAVTYRDAKEQETYEVKLNELTGTAEDQHPLHLFIKGAVQNVPYTVTLTGGSLANLVKGDAPWPLEFSAAAVGTRLTIKGEIAEPLLGKGLALDFNLKGPEMSELAAILGAQLPPVHSFNLKGRIEEAAGAYRVADLRGIVGGTALAGHFEVDTSGSRPHITGAVDIPVIDVSPFAAVIEAAGQVPQVQDQIAHPTQQQAQDKAESTAKPNQAIDLDKSILSLAPLEKFDADLVLTVREVVNSSLTISEASLGVHVADGTLRGPIAITIADVPFSGEIRLEPRDGMPSARLSVKAEKSDIGGLLTLLAHAEGIKGSFDGAKLEVSASGETIRSIVATTEFRFVLSNAALSYGNETGEQPVAFTLDAFEMMFPAAAKSRITATGSLLQEPFSLELHGGTFVENYIERNWPIEMKANGGGAEFHLNGTLERPKESVDTNLKFTVAGEKIGGLWRWVGISPEAEAPYALYGTLTISPNEVGVRIDKARIGDSTFDGQVGIKKGNQRPITVLELAFNLIDVTALAALFPEKAKAETQEIGKEAFSIDFPILPRKIEIIDSDIRVSVDRLKMEAMDITDISLSSKIRDGYVEKAPLRAVVAGAALEGMLSADLRGDIPRFDLALQSQELDLGALLAQLGIAEGLDVQAGSFALRMAMRGTSVRTILKQSEFSAGIQNGQLRLRDPNSGSGLVIGLPKGTIEAPVDKPITLSLDGRIDNTPVKIAIRTGTLASFAEKKSLQATLSAKLLDAELQLSGTAPLPLTARNLRFRVDFGGGQLSQFNGLTGVSLPPYGPYKLSGAFGSEKSGYYIKDLRLDVGSSTLTGAAKLKTTQSPPFLNVDLVANTVQLDDFDADDWSPHAGDSSTEQINAGTGAETLLSPQVMRSLNGKLSVRVQQVLSGHDQLGNGTLVADLNSGRLSVDPLSLNVPGGSVEVGFALQPTESEIGLEARAKVHKLDYGLLARRIDPQSTTGGLISVDIDIKTRGPKSAIMAESTGHIDFAVEPKDLNAGIFDLWAVNLLTAVLPSLDSEASKVNCVVARFNLNNGTMRPTALLIDTTRIQASGDGNINFKSQTIQFNALPSPKRPKMFSAQTPIAIEGRFEDFKVGLPPGALLGTVVRMATSPVVVPFQWVFTKNEPEDGKVACQLAWDRAPPTQAPR